MSVQTGTCGAPGLRDHPLAAAISDLPALRLFMEHHVFAVWDFLLLAKALQHRLEKVSAADPAPGPTAAAALIRRIVAEEECDQAPPNPAGASQLSHLQIYLLAMREVGARTDTIEQLLGRVQGLEAWTLRPGDLWDRLEGLAIPEPSRRFMAVTFAVIGTASALPMAVAFTHGRELLVPGLFQTLLDRALIPAERAPSLHWYLRRHVALDGDDHGPAALTLVNDLCGGSPGRRRHAATLADRAVEARRQFWDDIQRALALRPLVLPDGKPARQTATPARIAPTLPANAAP